MTRTAGTVLVADDDSDMRSLYQCWLAAFDEVRTAADGVEALRQLDDGVDVVVLDREMPRKGGVAVARELERRAIDPAVVMISAVEPDIDLLDIPVDDYLRKPVSHETILARVERAAAAAESTPEHRRLVAQDRRRRIVERAVSRHRLAEDPNYQRTVDNLACAESTLEAAHAAVPAVVGDGEPQQELATVNGCSREPRQ